MVSRGFKAMVGEANAAIETITVDDAKALHGGDAVFVDVREDGEWDKDRVAGALHASRGLLEFIADPEGPYHDPAFASGKKLVLYCASGGYPSPSFSRNCRSTSVASAMAPASMPEASSSENPAIRPINSP